MQTERSQYLTGSNPGADTKRTLSLAGLLIFTDAKITQHPETGKSILAYYFVIS